MSAAAPAAARKAFPSTLWFPVAAADAALMLPWSVLAQLGWVAAPGTLGQGLGHAHEMLFGFALAVVAGYTLRPGGGMGWGLLALWLGARASFLAWPASWLAAAFNGLFAIGLARAVAPSYLQADKWRNRSVAFIIVSMALAVLGFHALAVLARTAPLPALMQGAVLLVSALMFFMGGRILAPALAGHIRKRHPPLRHVVQARIEGATLALLAMAIACSLVPWPGARLLCGTLLLACSGLAAARMLRWRCWLCLGRADLAALLAGYAWLAIGWLLVGAAILAGAGTTAALHAITVGALGTLTCSVMLRTQMFRCRRDTNALPWAYAVAGLIALAAILRMAGGPDGALALAAACWGLAYACVCAALLGLARRRPAP